MQTIDKLKSILNCEKDIELANILNVHKSQVSRWRKSGFAGSIDRLVEQLLMRIELQGIVNHADKSKIDFKAVLSARNRIKSRTGFSNVEISELRRELGCDLEELKNFILQKSKEGKAVLSFGDMSLSDAETKEAAIELRGKSHLLVRFND